MVLSLDRGLRLFTDAPGPKITKKMNGRRGIVSHHDVSAWSVARPHKNRAKDKPSPDFFGAGVKNNIQTCAPVAAELLIF